MISTIICNVFYSIQLVSAFYTFLFDMFSGKNRRFPFERTHSSPIFQFLTLRYSLSLSFSLFHSLTLDTRHL